MKNTAVLSDIRQNKSSFSKGKFKPLLDIIFALTPILSFGTIGTLIGTDKLQGGFIVNFGYILSILLAGYILKQRGTSWRENGLARPESWRRTLLLSFGTIVITLALNIVVQGIALSLPGTQIAPVDQSRYNPLVGNFGLLVLMVVLAWTTITFGEEMFYRAFLINRLGKIFQSTRFGSAIAVLVSSIVFGFVHFISLNFVLIFLGLT